MAAQQTIDGCYPVSLSQAERWFVDTVHALGAVGLLVLRALTYLALKNGGQEVQIARATLARHAGRSVRTVSRTVARLKALALVEVRQPSPRGFECWECNVYCLTPLGRHLAALLGTAESQALSARDTGGASTSESSLHTEEDFQTSGPRMAHAENTSLFHSQPPVPPSLGPDLDPLVRDLERVDPQRFVSLRAWLRTQVHAGASRRHLVEALASLTANYERVRSWPGWLQNRLEALARAELMAERTRERILAGIRQCKQQLAQWAQEREQAPAGLSLAALVEAERAKRRAPCAPSGPQVAPPPV